MVRSAGTPRVSNHEAQYPAVQPFFRNTYSAEYGADLNAPALSQAPSNLPPLVLIRCTVVTPVRTPLPREETTCSFSQAISSAAAPGALPETLPTTALPSMCSQFGPA